MRQYPRWSLLWIVLLILSGCSKRPVFHGLTVKAMEWPVHDTRVCVFFGQGPTTNPIVGCLENEDGSSYFNNNDRQPDHLYLVDLDMPKEKYQTISEGRNVVVHCIRDSYTHIACR